LLDAREAHEHGDQHQGGNEASNEARELTGQRGPERAPDLSDVRRGHDERDRHRDGRDKARWMITK
jgi:hypothetical protein